MAKTYYEVLEVDRDASQEEITDAYRSKVKEYHPDVSDHEDAADRFQAVTRAEEVLGDEDERARYDRLGHDAYRAQVEGDGTPGSAGGGGDTGGGTGDRDASGRTTASGADDASRTTGEYDFGDTWTGAEYRNRRERTQEDRKRQAEYRRQYRRNQQENRKRRRAQAAGATASAGSGSGSTASRGGGSTDDSGSGTYSVYDWDEDELAPDPPTLELTQEAVVIITAIFVLYPVFVFFSVAPMFPFIVNLVVGACTLLTMGYLLTQPEISMVVFGAWSVLAPIGLFVFTDWAFLSPWGLFGLSAVWVPFGYSLMVSRVLRMS